jgi:hypothetical protein
MRFKDEQHLAMLNDQRALHRLRADEKAMPRYIPVEIGLPVELSPSDLIGVCWGCNGIAADFAVLDSEERALRVQFDAPCIVRLLDEMPLSTEDDDGPAEGLVGGHFAYRVEGAVFASSQSATWKMVHSPVSHYRFVTGWGCVDVLSKAQPSFSLTTRKAPASA